MQDCKWIKGKGDLYNSSSSLLPLTAATEPSDFSTVSSRQPMVAPKFTSPLRDANVSAGQPVTMECRVIGQPKPTVQWYKDSNKLEPSPDFQVVNYSFN